MKVELVLNRNLEEILSFGFGPCTHFFGPPLKTKPFRALLGLRTLVDPRSAGVNQVLALGYVQNPLILSIFSLTIQEKSLNLQILA